MFEVPARLLKDTVPVLETDLYLVRLMNDKRWPWLVVIPMRQQAMELFDLEEDDVARLFVEISRLAKPLKTCTGAAKINVGSLGHVVKELHVHVVARFEGDTNWPGPVWGIKDPQPWTDGDLADLLFRIRSQLTGLEA